MYVSTEVIESKEKKKKKSMGPFGKLTSRGKIIQMTVYLFFGTRSF